MITNATQSQLETALQRVNKKHGYALSFRNIEPVSKNRVQFTLKAESGKPGSRDSHSGRRGPYASWHAHGYFFDELFEIDPNIFIRSRGNKITAESGNWRDIQIGSMMYPCYMSELSNH